MSSNHKVVTARAPVNIAVIKYWGKANQELKIPINDSISGTISIDEMCATTTVVLSGTFSSDELWLNGEKQDMSSSKSQAKILLDDMRKLSKLEHEIVNCKAHIHSVNNFPTAAGLASSAAGYACLAYVLGHTYGLTDLNQLSSLARRGSGSACRSLFGGFVQWDRGNDHGSSRATQIVDHEHWPEMKVVICVINDKQKDVSSSEGMSRSVKTSQLIKHRADVVVPERIDTIRKAILDKDFETFANITMQDSNQFHAICLDTFPPIFYLNETSRQVIKICSIINKHFGQNKVAYTFDAGPNACIYLLDDFVNQFISIIKEFFPVTQNDGLQVKGRVHIEPNPNDVVSLSKMLKANGVQSMPDAMNYLINTSIGGGPKLVDDHVADSRS